MKTWFPSVLFIFVVGTIGLFVWPTKYRHFDYSGVPMRENRFTGKIEVLKNLQTSLRGKIFRLRQSVPVGIQSNKRKKRSKKLNHEVDSRIKATIT